VETVLFDAMKALGDAPGVDEFISLEILLQTMSSDLHDAVVFDTAPTGHTLRLMLLPRMLDGWIGRLLALRRHFTRLGRAVRRLVGRGSSDGEADITENLETVRDQVVRARRLITDPDRTRFVLVTIPEAMSVLETQRTMEQLGEQGIPVSVIIANQAQPPSDSCDHCRLRHDIHQRELLRLRDVAKDIPLRVVSSKSTVIRGPEALAELGRELWESQA
jgi:arsenite-transporting ATPase